MPGPLFLIVGPLILGAIALLLRRWQKIAALFGVGAILILVIGLTQISIDGGRGALGGDPWLVFGRTLAISESIRWTVLIMFVSMGLVFVLSFIFTQSTLFVPLGIAVLSPLAGALMIRPFEFGAILLLIAASVVALLIQGERAGSTLASWRHLSLFTLALPLLLAAGWMMETDQFQFLLTISTFFSLAFIIILAGFPFHIWVAPASTEANPLVMVVALGLVQLIVIIFCISLLQSNPTVLRSSQFSLFLRSSGIVTLLMASILALTAPSLRKLVGYLIMIDIGATIYAVALNSAEGLEISLTLVLLRTISLLMVATGLSMVMEMAKRNNDSRTTSESGRSAYRGIGRYSPLAAVLFIYGVLSLIGAPLTPGFSGKWALVTLAGQQSTEGATIIVFALVAGAIGLIKWIIRFWEFDLVDDFVNLSRPRGAIIAASTALLIGIIIALSPILVGELLLHISVP